MALVLYLAGRIHFAVVEVEITQPLHPPLLFDTQKKHVDDRKLIFVAIFFRTDVIK
jgi:hypothetical protein